MSKFRIAISGDFKKPDGSPAYPMWDMSPLDTPDIEYFYTPAQDEISATDMAECDALILLSQRFTRRSIPGNGRLAVVARWGVGYDTVDVGACSESGIAVAITPDGVRRPVAVAIITLMLALTGKLMVKDQIARQGPEGWAKKGDHMGVGLVGKTLGTVGLGNIGGEFFRMARMFDMKLLATDPYIDPQRAVDHGAELVDLPTLFKECDVVSVSCPLSDETRGMVNAEMLGLMKPTAFLINTARGPVVDQRALTAALTERRIAGAGIDVTEQEPPDADDPLLKLDNVILTPHALCWTEECFAGIGATDIKIVLDVKAGRVPTGLVDAEVADNPTWQDKLAAYRLAAYRGRFG